MSKFPGLIQIRRSLVARSILHHKNLKAPGATPGYETKVHKGVYILYPSKGLCIGAGSIFLEVLVLGVISSMILRYIHIN